MATTQLDFELKQGTMLRGMAGDIKSRYDNIMSFLYDSDYKGTGNYKESALFWATVISDFFSTEKDVTTFTLAIQKSLKNKNDLWLDEKWKKLMRIQLPIQIRRRMDGFTQVAKLAIMDEPRQMTQSKPIQWWE